MAIQLPNLLNVRGAEKDNEQLVESLASLKPKNCWSINFTLFGNVNRRIGRLKYCKIFRRTVYIFSTVHVVYKIQFKLWDYFNRDIISVWTTFQMNIHTGLLWGKKFVCRVLYIIKMLNIQLKILRENLCQVQRVYLAESKRSKQVSALFLLAYDS